MNKVQVEYYRSDGRIDEPDDGVRVTHIPTSIRVDYHEEKSLEKNRLKALTMLKAALILLGKLNE